MGLGKRRTLSGMVENTIFSGSDQVVIGVVEREVNEKAAVRKKLLVVIIHLLL